jgi:hypothetical protein
MKRTRNNRHKNNKTRKGGMKNESKIYPPLPESPTNRPPILTNNESLIPPKRESNQYIKRRNRLLNIFTKARQRTLKNIILGRKRPEPKLNSNGVPKSFFTVNNKVGFKP